MKKYSTSLIIREKQIKTTGDVTSHLLVYNRMAIIYIKKKQKQKDDKCCQGGGEIGNLAHCPGNAK